MFDWNTKFKPKSAFNSKTMTLLQEHIEASQKRNFQIDVPKDKFNNFSKEERDALYSLKNDNTSYKMC